MEVRLGFGGQLEQVDGAGDPVTAVGDRDPVDVGPVHQMLGGSERTVRIWRPVIYAIGTAEMAALSIATAGPTASILGGCQLLKNLSFYGPQRDVHMERLAEALTNLRNFVPETNEDLDLWYDRAKCILENPDLLKGAPHFLWHYLADADIRMNDAVYAEMQHRRIELVLQRLRRGEMPTDEETELS